MEAEKSPGGETAHEGRFRQIPWGKGSDPWLVALIVVSALGLIVLTLALTGHL
jgi:hypothetical protein